MSWLSEWAAKRAKREWKAALRNALRSAAGCLAGLRPDQVEAAKVRLCESVQRQRRIPGEFRRIAEREINAMSAKSVASLLIKLEGLL